MERWDGIWDLGTRPSLCGMTKSAGRIAREALAVGRRSFPAYGSRTFGHDFTQAPLFALLALRPFRRTAYRGPGALVAGWQDPRKALRLRKAPHYSAPAYAARHLLPEAEKGGLPPYPGRHCGAGPVCWSD